MNPFDAVLAAFPEKLRAHAERFREVFGDDLEKMDSESTIASMCCYAFAHVKAMDAGHQVRRDIFMSAYLHAVFAAARIGALGHAFDSAKAMIEAANLARDGDIISSHTTRDGCTTTIIAK